MKWGLTAEVWEELFRHICNVMREQGWTGDLPESANTQYVYHLRKPPHAHVSYPRKSRTIFLGTVVPLERGVLCPHCLYSVVPYLVPEDA